MIDKNTSAGEIDQILKANRLTFTIGRGYETGIGDCYIARTYRDGSLQTLARAADWIEALDAALGALR